MYYSRANMAISGTMERIFPELYLQDRRSMWQSTKLSQVGGLVWLNHSG